MAPTTRSSKRALPTPKDRQSKRRRLAVKVPTQPPLSSLVKHSELWFADGNIVLATEHACFKVHRSQLARFCTVFEDMFSQPSGGPDEEFMEDCVVVRMPDANADLTNFLQAMYNGCSFDFEIYAANFHAVAGVIRLATKYDCAVLRDRIHRNFSQHYPSCIGPIRLFAVFSTQQPYRVSIINLARECDLPGLLPVCFYHLAFPGGSGPSIEPLELLAPADRKRLSAGKKAVLRRVAASLAEGLPNLSQGCQFSMSCRARTKRTRQKHKCAIFLDTYWAEKVYPGRNLHGAVANDPLGGLTRLTHPPGLTLGPQTEAEPMCHWCRNKFRVHMDNIIATVWRNLSVDFML